MRTLTPSNFLLRFSIGLAFLLVCLISAFGQETSSSSIEGVTFASRPGCLFVPASEAAEKLGKPLSTDPDTGRLSIGGEPVRDLRHLFNGVGLLPVRQLESLGATVTWDEALRQATVKLEDQSFTVVEPAKSVVVDKSRQVLLAYQGSRLVMESHVSTGREGHGTPNGSFEAGPQKQIMHRSKLYNFSPMPYSVQVRGNVFIHGYTSVPNSPASHGCIRMPMTGGNPARYFYNWVDVGTPVTIQGSWDYRLAYHRRRSSQGGFRTAMHRNPSWRTKRARAALVAKKSLPAEKTPIAEAAPGRVTAPSTTITVHGDAGPP